MESTQSQGISPFQTALAMGGLGTISSFMGSRSAARAQADAARQMADMQWRIYQQQRKDAEPWRQAGITGLNEITNNLGQYTRDFTMADFQADPGYAFRMDQGLQGVQSSAAAKGILGSGKTLKDLMKYGQDYAANEYSNAYDRYNNNNTLRFNRLGSLANIGQTANGQLNQAAGDYMSAGTDSIASLGNARAAGAVAGANAINNGLGLGMASWMARTMDNRTPNYSYISSYMPDAYGYGTAGGSMTDFSNVA